MITESTFQYCNYRVERPEEKDSQTYGREQDMFVGIFLWGLGHLKWKTWESFGNLVLLWEKMLLCEYHKKQKDKVKCIFWMRIWIFSCRFFTYQEKRILNLNVFLACSGSEPDFIVVNSSCLWSHQEAFNKICSKALSK